MDEVTSPFVVDEVMSPFVVDEVTSPFVLDEITSPFDSVVDELYKPRNSRRIRKKTLLVFLVAQQRDNERY